jgi:hypothetical protein
MRPVRPMGLYSKKISDVIDFYGGSSLNYIDHMAPIWEALPPESRGSFIVNGQSFFDYASAKGVEPILRGDYLKIVKERDSRPVLLVAGLGSFPYIPGFMPKKVALLNHGAGQTWIEGKHPSYAGGRGRNRFAMILEPGDIPAQADEKVCHGQTLIRVVGCPKMDKHYPIKSKLRDNPPTVAIGFHHDVFVNMESRSAFKHYSQYLPEFIKWAKMSGEINLIGVGHPKAAWWRTLSRYWDKYGVEAIADWNEAMGRADLYIRDQHSTIYEFASLDRPVILLNAPWYRRNIEHGIRFWQYANVGIQVNNPDELIPAVRKALEDPPKQQELRHKAVNAVYKYMDGRSSERAANALLELL